MKYTRFSRGASELPRANALWDLTPALSPAEVSHIHSLGYCFV
ncbi:hypothetical protein A33I_06880 [Alkalihalophilus marmarensis DSM 21297]|jgi:hypothetical protein|uniref:Uncharacterized protein n=1 Tax=Alkalihalophilus marmarensis DSM 21297 TaxID=1188261 RepID=U6SRX6_9BACI|nr:hypothetical protein A33I_06880 [Alkalihalophilus marmarensis DSM 21297]